MNLVAIATISLLFLITGCYAQSSPRNTFSKAEEAELEDYLRSMIGGGGVRESKGGRDTTDREREEGHIRDRRYVNGQEYVSEKDVPPYLVRINRKDISSGKKWTLCAGSIISSNLVLTSGGCLFENWRSFEKEKRLVPIWQIEVVAGDFNSSVTETTEQTRTPIQMYIHPQIKMVDHRKMWQNDIAIIQVDTDFKFNDNVNKIELWLSHFAVNETDYEYYTLLRASGYGDWGSHNSKQYDNLFDTSYPFSRHLPQYQYLAYMQGGDCVARFSGVNDVETEMVTHRPGAVNPYTAKPLLTAKRCFYTSSTGLVGYIPSTGDYGGPITWTNRDENVEYQVMITPWEPESKASFETDMNYVHWGELLTYYKDFIGNVFDRAASKSKADHYPHFTFQTNWTTFVQSMSLEYLGHFQYYTRFTVESGKYVQVNITLTGENSAHTMRNSVVTVRRSGTKKVLQQFLGLNRTKTESVIVTPGGDGTKGSKWGCTLKGGVVYTNPPTLDPAVTTELGTETITTESDSETLSESSYTCEDSPVNSVGGDRNTPSTFTLNSRWETVFFNSTAGDDFEVEFLINRPPHSADKGAITLKVDYIYLNDNKYVDVKKHCDAGHLMCDDELSCVDPDHVCDQDPDCYDKNDESFWCLHKPCLSSQYQCTTGECVHLRALCDGKCDCLDHAVCEDETLLCSDSPFRPDSFPRFLLEQAALRKKEAEIPSSADRFEIALNILLFFTYGLCYIME